MTTGIWNEHDQRKAADALRDNLRLPTAAKHARDVVVAKEKYDTEARYEASTQHRPLGGGNFMAVNQIGDNCVGSTSRGGRAV